MTTTATVRQAEIAATGVFRANLELTDAVTGDSRTHRVSFEVGEDFASKLADASSYLEQMGSAPLSALDLTALQRVYSDWLAAGNTNPPPYVPTAEEVASSLLVARAVQDTAAAKAYAKLAALKAMTPAQIQTWTTANVTTLAQARDAITTLAIAVSILARRL